MANLEWVIMQLIDCMLYFLLGYSLYQKNIKGSVIKGICFLCITISIFILEEIAHIKIAFILPVILLFMMLDTKIWIKMGMVFSITLIVMLVQQFLSLSLFPHRITKATTNINMFGICCAVVIVLLSIFIKYIKKHTNFTFNLNNVPFYIYTNIILAICAGVLPLMIINYLENQVPFRLRIAIIFISYFSILCGFFTVYVFVRNYREKDNLLQENELKNKLLEMQKRNYYDTVKNYEYLRKFKHDTQGYLRVISQLESQNAYSALHSYVQKLENRLHKKQIFQCPNIYVSALINSYIVDMEQKNIALKVMYSVNGHLKIDELDLGSILYNLLSNAFEAERQVTKDVKVVTLSFLASREDLLIEVKNDIIDDSCLPYILTKKSSKKDAKNHGIGLKNVEGVVKKYNGELNIDIEKDTIVIEVFLKDVVFIDEEGV